MKTLFMWCSLILWLNVAPAAPYHNPFVASGANSAQQNATHSSQPMRNLPKIQPIISAEMTGSAKTQRMALSSNLSRSSGFGIVTSNTSVLASKNTSHLSSGVATLLTTGGTAVILTGAAGVTGSLATVGLMSLATAVGTASTGTAIASLSGAAAYSSALAWLGGGALSAGGFGMAGGAVVLSGGALLAVVGASAAVMYWFQMGDEKTEQQRIEYLLDSVKQNII